MTDWWHGPHNVMLAQIVWVLHVVLFDLLELSCDLSHYIKVIYFLYQAVHAVNLFLHFSFHELSRLYLLTAGGVFIRYVTCLHHQ